MTEPRGGSDPTGFVTRAERDGDEWVINGEKWFSSHANFAEFLIVLAVTDPNEERHRRMSMFVVDKDTPGVEIVRNVGIYGHPEEEATHSYVRYTDVRIPADHLLGGQRRGLPRGPDPPRRRAHPPRDAHHRAREERVRPDVRARPVARPRRARRWRASSSCRR